LANSKLPQPNIRNTQHVKGHGDYETKTN